MTLTAAPPMFHNVSHPEVSPADRLALYHSMLKIRRVEERIQALYPEGDMRCPTHFSIGQEAIAAGICKNLRNEDYVISAHRSHAHYIAKNASLRSMFAELYGKSTGCASGKGGSMHLIDLSVNFLGCVPIVGSTIPIGVGAAFGSSMDDNSAITVVFFGDAATETGVFHESVNFAALHKLPVLFVCENNLYSVNTPLEDRQPTGRSIAELARGHGIPASQHDGQTVETVDAIAAQAIASIRNNEGPVLLEFITYRWLEHCGPSGDIHLGYRTQKELDVWVDRCPLALHRHILDNAGILNVSTLAKMEADVAAEIDDAVSFARTSPFPTRAELGRHLFSEPASVS